MATPPDCSGEPQTSGTEEWGHNKIEHQKNLKNAKHISQKGRGSKRTYSPTARGQRRQGLSPHYLTVAKGGGGWFEIFTAPPNPPQTVNCLRSSQELSNKFAEFGGKKALPIRVRPPRGGPIPNSKSTKSPP